MSTIPLATESTSPLEPNDQDRTSPRPRKRNLLLQIKDHWADYMYIMPALLVMVLVIGYPLFYTVYLSFFDTPPSTGGRVFNGIDNFTTILQSERFWMITKNTFYWTVFSTLIAFILGFGAALVIQREFFGRSVARGILLIPWVISYVAAAYVWRWICHSDYGLLGGMLMEWGITDQRLILLDSTRWVMPSLIVANVWKEFPFVMIMLLAGLQTVPDQLMRAARVDGANSWNQFVHVTVPHLKNVIVITLLLLFVTNLNSFGLVWIMTGGGPANASQLWIIEIYTLAFRSLRFGLASAFSVILFIFMLGIGFFYVKALTAGDNERGRA
ncbi:MAG TPA: sugar ABC transporter permease [Thermomicrobiales bacterium]|nr:sugar ABC transporter permease [Thermomicrobiales bacterium]